MCKMQKGFQLYRSGSRAKVMTDVKHIDSDFFGKNKTLNLPNTI